MEPDVRWSGGCHLVEWMAADLDDRGLGVDGRQVQDQK